jgi:hypothetical protein
MITADPQRRVSTLARILDHVGRTAPDADRDLLLALAPVVYGDMPDALALRLSVEAIAARLAGIFRFVGRTMPPAVQLYKGLPGLHVSVRNPDDVEARAEGSTHEVTIVETHCPDARTISRRKACASSRRSTRSSACAASGSASSGSAGRRRTDRASSTASSASSASRPGIACAASSTRCSRC